EDLGLRLRLFGRAGLRLGDGWGVVAWDELFVQLNEPGWTAPQGIDQNRLFIGLMVQPTPRRAGGGRLPQPVGAAPRRDGVQPHRGDEPVPELLSPRRLDALRTDRRGRSRAGR
ncbi:MAG: DUF2490 domain-containing protein, partial [Deltaproteobacteria bacterium]|nr:DUF2490 domain-containing protein [Deltaproteobacteria bacterium]